MSSSRCTGSGVEIPRRHPDGSTRGDEDHRKAARRVGPAEPDLQRPGVHQPPASRTCAPAMSLTMPTSLDSVSPNFPSIIATGVVDRLSVPMLRQHIRLRHLPTIPCAFACTALRRSRSARERDGRRELELDRRDLPAKPGEADMPDWYPHWASIEFSDMVRLGMFWQCGLPRCTATSRPSGRGHGRRSKS